MLQVSLCMLFSGYNHTETGRPRRRDVPGSAGREGPAWTVVRRTAGTPAARGTFSLFVGIEKFRMSSGLHCLSPADDSSKTVEVLLADGTCDLVSKRYHSGVAHVEMCLECATSQSSPC